jgi:hypothetical protein
MGRGIGRTAAPIPVQADQAVVQRWRD